MCNVHHLRFREVQDLFDTLRLFIFHVEDDFGLAVIDDSFSVLAVIQGKKVVEVLGGKDGRTAVATDGPGGIRSYG